MPILFIVGYAVFFAVHVGGWDVEGSFQALIDGAADAPVSYTHLRAHETVLDLVCRLLLEKKKKPT